MARKGRAGGSIWTGENRDTALDGLFSSMRAQGQQELNGPVSIGTESEANLVGLPLPALCLRYLLQSTVLPLSRIFQITGEEGSCKSGLLYEMMRWHMVYGGGAVLAENEDKDSPELRNGILDYREDWIARMLVKQTHCLEAWQDVVSTFIALARKQQDAADGPGRTIPICFGVDSLMATAPQEEIDLINKEGHASRGFALAANLIARYMRTMPERIQDYPLTVVGTNHLKPAVDRMGRPANNIPGGKAVKFMETYELEMRRDSGADIDKLEYGGIRVKIIARKNSLGPSRKSITAELLWWFQPLDNGEFRQRFLWDWHTATVEMVNSFETAPGKKTIYNHLRDITGIKVESKSQRLAYSEVLGIPKSDPQPYRTVGAALEGRDDILAEVNKVLGITPRRPFQPGVDYRDLMRTARAEARAQAANLYTNVQDLPVVANGDYPVYDVSPEDDHGGPTSEERADADTN